jgi:dolichol-phosphate mannosyltransferase
VRGWRRPRTVLGWATLGLRLAAGTAALVRLGRAATAAPPLAPSAELGVDDITVVIPARDEAARIGPCLRGVVGAPGVREVIVVDDESTDGTAGVASSLGARVVPGCPLPPGWVGKPWALQQGLDAAAPGGWFVSLDADTAPDPRLPAALVARARTDGWDLLTCGARFTLTTTGQRLVHPSLLATLVYRFGPPGARRPARPARTLANGQCTVARTDALRGADGFAGAAGHLTDDVALARHLAAAGWRVGFGDAGDLVGVRMHETAGEAWRNWGRSLPMPDVTSPAWQAADLAVVWLAQALPIPRLLTGRGDALDAVLAVARLGTHAGTARAYEPGSRGPWWWLAPLADLAVAARLTQAAVRPERTWRGRSYAG